jgi:ubiquinone/menaquinone biosynthesis C-methylase UbiE
LLVVSERLLSIVCCPNCHGPLARGTALVCPTCSRRYASTDDHVDLRPSDEFVEQTKYLDEALHADARHETVSPPLLSAAVRNDMLRAFLEPAPGDRVIDLGCGSGRVLVWNQDLGAYQVGIDVSPFFAHEARVGIDLALGDLRRLPFADATFNKAYALDVFEHLSRDGLRGMLREAARVLEPGGTMFVYSHVRKNSWVAGGLRLINRLAKRLERAGAVDLSQERLRKSDHLNPLQDIPDLITVVGEAGFRIARIRYYTPLVGGLVENVCLRVAERWMARQSAPPPGTSASTSASHEAGAGADGRATPSDEERGRALGAARAAAKQRIARRGPIYAGLRALTVAMKLDVLLFGRITSGPFFALLVKDAPRNPAA